MRTLTANYLEIHKEHFVDFCQKPFEEIVKEVLKMGKEADGIGIGPLQVIFNIKIDIVTIDRNHQQELFFETIKVSGKLPVVSILYKPGHYDIIYSSEISAIDGFDERTCSYQGQQIPLGYNIENPGLPVYFFYPLTKGEQNSPKNENAELVQLVDFPYQKTWTPANQKSQIQDQSKKMLTCQQCQRQQSEDEVVQLTCQHNFDKKCLFTYLERQTGNKYIQAKGDSIQEAAKCPICEVLLTNEKIKEAIGIEKYNEAMKMADQRAIQLLMNQPQKQIQQQQQQQQQRYKQDNQINPVQQIQENKAEIQKHQFKIECTFKCQKEGEQLLFLLCNHKFCKSSIVSYLYEKTNGFYLVDEGEIGYGLICPAQNCNHQISYNDIQIILGFDFYKKKYEELQERRKNKKVVKRL